MVEQMVRKRVLKNQKINFISLFCMEAVYFCSHLFQNFDKNCLSSQLSERVLCLRSLYGMDVQKKERSNVALSW